MKLITRIVALFLLLTMLISFAGQASAKKQFGEYLSTKVLYKLDHYIKQKFSPRQRASFLNQKKFQEMLTSRLHENAFQRFGESHYYHNESVIDAELSGDTVVVSYNKLAVLDEEAVKRLRSKMREKIVKVLVKRYPEVVKEELTKFYFDINEEGLLSVQAKPYKEIEALTKNKNVVLDDYIENIITPNGQNNKLALISQDNHINAYYNYLKLQGLYAGHARFNINDIKQSIIFRNADDVKNLLAVNSFRTRKEFRGDVGYRKYNIHQIYNTFGSLIEIMPGETISYNDIYKKGDDGNKFRYGIAIVNNKEKRVYGGGTCGGSTGMYQGALGNGNLAIKSTNHGWWYNSLYRANIDGEVIKTPGLDSTYYTDSLDLKITNTSDYPVFMFAQIDKKEMEKNFTLSFAWDVKKEKMEFLERKGKCFYWKRGEETIKSCYRKGV